MDRINKSVALSSLLELLQVVLYIRSFVTSSNVYISQSSLAHVLLGVIVLEANFTCLWSVHRPYH